MCGNKGTHILFDFPLRVFEGVYMVPFMYFHPVEAARHMLRWRGR